MVSTASGWPEILITDTMSGKKKPLATLVPGEVGIYCCGPTVYDMSHIGHARAALSPDVMVRFLRQQGYRVRYVRNITDIDDKIIARAQQDGLPAADVAARYADEYHRDLAALGMLVPDVEPRVSDHLPEIIALVETLQERGLAYAVDGDVYYRVNAFGPYGRLSGRSRDELLGGVGSRVDVDERKENPLDFALWKAAKPGEPAWDSPWGPGRPGWHIECSAMSSTHLGRTFDIHGGGRDLIFPHHENEIAQSQGAYGEGTFARYWIHNGFINFGGEKMSKSLGNVWTIRDILGSYPAEALRYFLLGVHYRSGLNFEVEVLCPACRAALDAAAQTASRCAACGGAVDAASLAANVRFPGLEDADDRVAYVYGALAAVRAALGDDPAEGATDAAASGATAAEPSAPAVGGMLAAFTEAMRNDFNTPAALGVLSKPLNEIYALLASGKDGDKAARRRALARWRQDMRQVATVLGCFGQDPDQYLRDRRALKACRLGLDIAAVEDLLARRATARTARDWAEADRLRDRLAALGVGVQDGPRGSIWTL
ncbi:MAG: cysteine--tRNA ligase [Candidatus Krumholzibacteria bacterium]|jgi:cysteinyl-tRNA synthetase|nr:cysteine--tRNA ligase [Candidatus Krumholzibacteria bacterium]